LQKYGNFSKFVGQLTQIPDLLKRFWPKLHLTSRTGDEKSLGASSSPEEIYQALAPKMMALCLRYMDNREDAEDVLQEGFITLFNKLDSYQGTGSFEGWARKIFVNTALMHLRKTDALGMSDEIEQAYSLFTEEATPVQKIGYKELIRLIESLPPDARTVFNMYVIEGYSHKEIAEELGCTEATSRSKLQRARLRLQEMISESQ
jgi:RNA polymerase sigma-70 factor (ECF subfamily)